MLITSGFSKSSHKSVNKLIVAMFMFFIFYFWTFPPCYSKNLVPINIIMR